VSERIYAPFQKRKIVNLLACICRCGWKSPSEMARVLESLRWEWEPDGCRLHPYNNTRLRELLAPAAGIRRHKLLFFGDSTHFQVGAHLYAPGVAITV
jgi:hypothetical protein